MTNGTWHNEPSAWQADGDRLTLITGPKTDFWRTTHYDFVRDTGHFRSQQATGDFVAEVKVIGAYASLYDQAGVMVRLDDMTWLKCGIELVDGVQQVSAVVTRAFSDWSVVPLPANPPALWLRLTRRGPAIEIHYSLDGTRFDLLRMAYLSPAATLRVGPMAASPEGPGFQVTFEGFTVHSL